MAAILVLSNLLQDVETVQVSVTFVEIIQVKRIIAICNVMPQKCILYILDITLPNNFQHASTDVHQTLRSHRGC